jgi:hypothetical protein
MTLKPFIHPDIIIDVKEAIGKTYDAVLNENAYTEAQLEGVNIAEDILKVLYNSNLELGAIKSHFNTDRLSSVSWKSYKEQLVSLHYQQRTFAVKLSSVKKKETETGELLSKAERSFFRFFLHKRILRLSNELAETKVEVAAVQELYDESYMNIKFKFEGSRLVEGYSDMVSAFTTLRTVDKFWHVTFQQANLDTKAAASTNVTRTEIHIDFSGVSVITTTEKVLHIENRNGGEFYLYPNFILYYKNNDEIALIDYSDLVIQFSQQLFLEENDSLPRDAKVIGETWYRVNKDGSPDRRFVSNHKIPKVLYGAVHLRTLSGINELYYISDIEKAKHFHEQYDRYRSLLVRKI